MRKIFAGSGVLALAIAAPVSVPTASATTDYACHEEFVPDPIPPDWDCDDVGNPTENDPGFPVPPPPPPPWPDGRS